MNTTDPRSARAAITEGERMQLIGLFTVHAELRRQMDTVEAAALRITRELERDGTPTGASDGGHTTDYLWAHRSLDSLLDVLGLGVFEEEGETATPVG